MSDIIATLERLLNEARKPPDDWWDSDQCAAYLHMESADSFRRSVACKPDFPKRLRPTGGQKIQLWLADDVRKWARRNVGKAA